MFRQFTFGVVAAAALAFCAADLQAQCVGCGGSTPIYSQPINAGYSYGYAQPVYGTVAYGQPAQGCCGQMTYASAPVNNGCCNNGCYSAPVQSCCRPRMMRTNCCRPMMARTNCCQPMRTSCCQPMATTGCCGNMGQMTYTQGTVTSACGCGGTVMGGGMIMDGTIQPQEAGGAVDQANPPVPVETDTKVEEKTPAPAEKTETAAEKK